MEHFDFMFMKYLKSMQLNNNSQGTYEVVCPPPFFLFFSVDGINCLKD